MEAEVKKMVIDTRERHFQIRKKDDREIFYDLCFCLLAPQTKFAYNRVATGNLISNDFYSTDIPEQTLHMLIRGARFYRIKTQRILETKKNFPKILEVVRNPDISDVDKREWLVENVNGLGMKAASHFLRNLGNETFAIVDTHIIKYMGVPKPRNKQEYITIEKMFIQKAKEMNVSPAELDMAIWKEYSGTDWEDYSF